MQKFIKPNGEIEYFTTDKDKFLEIAYQAEDFGATNLEVDGWDHSPIGFREVSKEDLSEATFAYAQFGNITYYYGIRKFHHVDGYIIPLEQEANYNITEYISIN